MFFFTGAQVGVKEINSTGFSLLTEGVNRIIGPNDLDALIEFIQSQPQPQPFDAQIEGRISRLN